MGLIIPLFNPTGKDEVFKNLEPSEAILHTSLGYRSLPVQGQIPSQLYSVWYSRDLNGVLKIQLM